MIGRLEAIVLWLVERLTEPGRREDLRGDLEEMRARARGCARSAGHERRPRRPFVLEAIAIGGGLAGARLVGSLESALDDLRNGGWRPVPADLRAAVRRLGRSPVFTATAIATVALGVASLLLSMALVRGVLLDPLPYDAPHRLVAIFATERDGRELRNPASPANYLDWKRQARTLRSMTAARPWSPTLGSGDRPLKVSGLRATPELFDLLGVVPREGLPFVSDALESGELPVVVSHSLWQRLGSSVSPGTILQLDGEPYRVTAVMPPGFVFPPFWADEADLWAPLDLGPDPARDQRFLRVFARLEDGVEVGEARAEIEAIASRLRRDHPEVNRGVGARVELLSTPTVDGPRPAVLALLLASLILLLLVTFNLASLLLARRLRQRHELAVRAALGASRLRLFAGSACETVLLAGGGAVLGIFGALSLLPLLRAWASPFLPRVADLRIDAGPVALVTLLFAVVALLLAVPGVRAGASAPSVREGKARRRQTPGSRALVVAELSIAIALLVAAGLLLQSFRHLARQELGFDPRAVAVLRVDLGSSSHSDPERQALFFRELEDRLTAEPSVAAAGLVNHLPIAGDLWRTRVFAPGRSAPDDDLRAAIRVASPGYLEALGGRLTAGRWIEGSDRDDGDGVVVVNRRLAERLWPGEDPVGKELATGSLGEDGTRRRVVGVVADLKQTGLADRVVPELFVPLTQNPFFWFPEATIVLRAEEPGGSRAESAGKLSALAARVENVVLELDRAVPVYDVASLESIVADDLRDRRLQAGVFGLFSTLSLLLAAYGLFAVISYATASRSFEFAVRRALGSQNRQVASLVLGEGLRLALLGIVLGSILSLGLARALEPLLFGLDPLDAGVWGSAVLLVLVTTLAGSAMPALKAARTPFSAALREP